MKDGQQQAKFDIFRREEGKGKALSLNNSKSAILLKTDFRNSDASAMALFWRIVQIACYWENCLLIIIDVTPLCSVLILYWRMISFGLPLLEASVSIF